MEPQPRLLSRILRVLALARPARSCKRLPYKSLRGRSFKGHLFIIDQCNAYERRSEEIAAWSFSHVRWEGIFEERMLSDGRTFRVVKVFYHPRLLAERVKQLGFEVTAERMGENATDPADDGRLFYLSGTRLRP